MGIINLNYFHPSSPRRYQPKPKSSPRVCRLLPLGGWTWGWNHGEMSLWQGENESEENRMSKKGENEAINTIISHKINWFWLRVKSSIAFEPEWRGTDPIENKIDRKNKNCAWNMSKFVHNKCFIESAYTKDCLIPDPEFIAAINHGPATRWGKVNNAGEQWTRRRRK